VRTSDRGIAFIKEREGFVDHAYQDSVGVWTKGYGSTANVHPGDTITEEDAAALLRAEVVHYENCIDHHVTVDMNQNEYDALVSLCYNIGCENFAKSSVLRFLNLDHRQKAADAFLLWCKGKIRGELIVLPGLKNRRVYEREMFLAPYNVA
jgi:GH24 family phage-related lysozyme (muramidase)